MFSSFHVVWIGLCAVLIGTGVFLCMRKNVSTRALLRFCCYGAALSEVTKVLSVVEIVPSSDGSLYYPYLQMQHMPFHFCSLMVFVIFWMYFTKSEKIRDSLLQFSFPVCLFGGVLAIFIPTIFGNSIRVDQAFTHPLAYQYFLYHCMLVVLAVQIARDRSVCFSWRGYANTMKLLGGLAFASIYLNSLFSAPLYENGRLLSVEYGTNLMFTFKFPLGITFATKEQWLLYLALLGIGACVGVALLYLPLVKRRVSQEESVHLPKS